MSAVRRNFADSLEPIIYWKAFQLMSDFSLLPTDTFHITTALENGVNSFVTLDEDFLSIDGIIVYTCLR
jgi:predicted nucleic acid-binding protein